MRYVIPIAERDTLFPREEFHLPKPLVEVGGSPMIALVVESIRARDLSARFVFVILREHAVQYSLDATLRLLAGPDSVVVEIAQPTMGATCTVLMAIDHIADDEPLVICNGDQVIDEDFGPIGARFVAGGYEGGVVTFPSVHPRWSYVREDERGEVTETAEKRVLSRRAIAGYYFFRSGRLFVEAAQRCLMKAAPVGGKYYLSSVLNELILAGGRVGQHALVPGRYTSFYSPQRIELFQQDSRSIMSLTQGADPSARRTDSSVQIVIPMAGRGSRFSDAGYRKPKPFIDVEGKTMIERVMDNLAVPAARFVLIAQQAHLDAEPEVAQALLRRGDVRFSMLDTLTEGAACTVLTCRSMLDRNAPLLIANCDQLVDFRCTDYVADAQSRGLDGSILCFRDAAMDPKWSFVRLDPQEMVVEAREKVAISDLATVGLYYFRRAGDYLDAASDMIAVNDRVNDEFYVCPVYNYAVKAGCKVGVHLVPPEAMHGIGTPADLEAYLRRAG